MFLTARMFMHRHVYLHRTVRAIDLDLAEVFGPSILAVFGDGSPVDRLGAFADLDEYALLHQAALWARGERVANEPAPGDGTVTRAVADAWRAILLRRPRWRLEREVHAETDTPDWPPELLASLGRGRAGSRRARPDRRGRAAGGGQAADARHRAARRRTGPDAGRGARPRPGLVADRPALPAGGLTPAGRGR